MAGTIYHNWQCTKGNFATEIPSELLCPICSEILRDPFQTQCCGKHYCHDCLQTLLNEGKPCFSCKSHVRAFRDVNAANRVNALAVRCSHEAWGCLWRGELGGLGEHLLQCAKRPVRCDLCGDTVLNENLDAHKSTQCMKRRFQCSHCNNFESTYETVRDDHWPMCLYYPIPCPNKCSEDSILRGRIFQHLREECEVRQEVMKMAELKAQLQEMTEHLKTRDERIEQLEKEVREKESGRRRHRTRSVSHTKSHLEQENTHLVEQVKTQESTIKELRVQNENLKDNLARMEEELAAHQEGMKDVTEKLREEKEQLETKLSNLRDEKQQLEAKLSKFQDVKEKV